MQLTSEDKLLLSVVKITPSTEELEIINALIPQIIDWDYFTNTIIDRGSAPLFYKKLSLLKNSSVIPPNVKAKLQQAYLITLSRSMVLYNHFKKNAEVLNAHNIPIIALKGIYLSEWMYHDIGLRQFSDMDILVREADGEKCLQLLAEMGYKPRKSSPVSQFIADKSDIVHYSPMELNDISVEIHIKLHLKKEHFHLPLDEIWQRAMPATVNNVSVFALEIYDLMMHLCIHLHKHFLGGHLQFTCFNDITNLLEKEREVFDWELFENRCKQYNCVVEVYKYLVLVHKYFDATVPSEIINKYNSLLDIADEELFYKYLHGYIVVEENKSAVPEHINNLKLLTNPLDYVKYLVDLIFPPKKFMIEKYLNQLIINNSQFIIKEKEDQSIIHNSQTCPTTGGFINEKKEDQFITKKNKLDIKQLCIMNSKLCIKFWWLWYPYRWWIGAKGVVKLVFSRK
jgi:hypothetical protein